MRFELVKLAHRSFLFSHARPVLSSAMLKHPHFSSSTHCLSASAAASGVSPKKVEGEEIQLTMPWGQVSGLSFGPTEGMPVLALHGWLDNANSFHELAAYLPPTVRFVAVDLPGHGFSSHRPVGAKYTFVDWVREEHHSCRAKPMHNLVPFLPPSPNRLSAMSSCLYFLFPA